MPSYDRILHPLANVSLRVCVCDSVINVEVILYAVLYAPLLYYTFVVDSKYLRNSKAERRMLITRDEYVSRSMPRKLRGSD